MKKKSITSDSNRTKFVTGTSIQVKADGRKKSSRLTKSPVEESSMTTSKKPLTPKEQAIRKVAGMFSFYDDPTDDDVDGGWIYDWDTEKYLDYNGEWTEDIMEENARIPTDSLEEARNILKRVMPSQRIVVVTP